MVAIFVEPSLAKTKQFYEKENDEKNYIELIS